MSKFFSSISNLYSSEKHWNIPLYLEVRMLIDILLSVYMLALELAGINFKDVNMAATSAILWV